MYRMYGRSLSVALLPTKKCFKWTPKITTGDRGSQPSQVVLRQTTNCSRAEVLPQPMFCRQKNFVCDQRPVLECRQNAIVWRRRRWRVGSRQPGSSGRGHDRHRWFDEQACQRGDLVADALPHWKPVQLAKHRWDVVTSSCASDQPGRSILHRLQTSHQLVSRVAASTRVLEYYSSSKLLE